MGYQLPIHEASDVIVRAMRAAGENLDADFSHIYSRPGHQGFYTEIADLGIKRKTGSEISTDYTFSLNFPYDYFNDAELNIDNRLGIKITDDCEVKAEIRCMDLITKTYERWLPDHDVFTTQDLMPIINEALEKLSKIKHIELRVHGNKKEIAEKYAVFYFTESHIPQASGTINERFFPVEFYLKQYYAKIGDGDYDNILGETKLRTMSKKDICLLRVTYCLYKAFLEWLRNNWPDIYLNYENNKF